MIDDIKKDSALRMQKSLDALKVAFTRLRTGRANAGILEPIKVDYYGSDVPLSQVASVVVEDARTISITPWEKGMVTPIEKAIMASDLGLTPNTSGMVIRIILPPLTEERRRDLAKVVRQESENSRVSIRNVRRDANQEIKELLKEKLISSDDEKRGETEIQKLTDQFIAKVEEAAAAKEREILAI